MTEQHKRIALAIVITALGVGAPFAWRACDAADKEYKRARASEKVLAARAASEKGKRHCKLSCKTVKGRHTAHGPNKCVCEDKDGCVIVFPAQSKHEHPYKPYIYNKPPVTVGKCAGRVK